MEHQLPLRRLSGIAIVMGAVAIVGSSDHPLVHAFSARSTPTTRITRPVLRHPINSFPQGGTTTIAESSSHHQSQRFAMLFSTRNDDQEEDPKSGVTMRRKKTTLLPPLPPKPKNLRMQVFRALNHPLVEIATAAAVLLSSFLVALNTLPDLSETAYEAIRDIILILDILFAIDFFCRWYAAGQFQIKYLTKPLAVIDIVVVIIPLVFGSLGTILPYMPLDSILSSSNLAALPESSPLLSSTEAVTAQAVALSSWQNSAGLQNLLLLRVLKLRRVLTDMTTFARFEIALGIQPKDVRPYQLQLARALLSIFTLLSVSAGLIFATEHEVNPDISDYFCALYFSLTTLTTVGLGDVAPVTAYGRLVVSGSILAGVAIIPAQAANFVEAFIEFTEDRKLAKRITIRAPPKKRKSRRPIADGKGPTGIDIEVGPKDSFVRSLSSTSSSLLKKNHKDNNDNNKIDGKGPRGVDIETPVKEKDWSPRITPSDFAKAVAASTTTPDATTATSPSSSKKDAWAPLALATTTSATPATNSNNNNNSSSCNPTPRRSCGQCGVYPHRMDAFYCWSCGNELPPKIEIEATQKNP